MLSRTILFRASAVACALAASTIAGSAAAQVEPTQDFTPAPAPIAAEPTHSEPTEAAPTGPAPATAERERESYWYGWQTLTADGMSIATMIAGGAAGSPTLGYIGLGGYFVAAPVVHGVQGRVGVAFGSFGLRVGAPALGAVIGYAAAGPCRDQGQFLGCLFHGWAEAAVGGLVGAGAAIALDAALLANGTRLAAPPRETGMPKVTSLAPSFDPRTGAAGMGVGGTF